MKVTTLCAALIASSSVPALAGPAQPKADPGALIDHPAAPKVDITGGWQVEGRITARGETIAATRPLCVFSQQNGALSGNCKGPNSQGPVQGIVYGKHVRWTWRSAPFTQKTSPGVTTFDGALEADGAIKGLWSSSVLPGLSGKFVQTRQKPSAP